MQETLYLITLKTIKHMKISTKAASFLSSIKTQTYDKKEREMIINVSTKTSLSSIPAHAGLMRTHIHIFSSISQ